MKLKDIDEHIDTLTKEQQALLIDALDCCILYLPKKYVFETHLETVRNEVELVRDYGVDALNKF